MEGSARFQLCAQLWVRVFQVPSEVVSVLLLCKIGGGEGGGGGTGKAGRGGGERVRWLT